MLPLGSPAIEAVAHRQVGALDLALLEQISVGASTFASSGEEHQAGGVEVEAVDRGQLLAAGVLDQPVEQALVDVAPAGHHRQEVGLVGDQ